MNRAAVILWVVLILCSTSCASKKPLAQNTPVVFTDVTICDNFWSPKIDRLIDVTIPFCLDQCMNQTSRVNNFAIAAGVKEGEWKGLFYDDSDLYKMIEGAAYSLQHRHDPALEKQIDSIISLISKAQLPDGYIDTYYILAHPGDRWTDMDKHEMYCGGHLIEAAIAYFDATGKTELLEVAQKYADHMLSIFGEGKRDWVPGHPEIELALVKLYRQSGEKKYLDFAHFLLEQRGRGKADWGEWTDYYVDKEPVAQMTKICGHAVRCMYLFTGMADYAAQSIDTTYIPALDRLWENVVNSRMYQTGGVGSSRKNEGFTEDYDLPNEDAYCETCSSVGMILWNQRMNMLKGNAKYIDVLERSMYNGALAGISLSSDRFFYVNPLASSGNHHRKPWYGTACCPSQISRFLPSIGGYIYATSNNAIWVNLFVQSKTALSIKNTAVSISQETAYPWDGAVKLNVEASQKKEFDIKIRVPSWCKKYSIRLDGKECAYTINDGYAVISHSWSKNEICIDFDMPVEVIKADERVEANVGRRAIQRGPIVYCLEQVDNPLFDENLLHDKTRYEAKFEGDLLGGVVSITAMSNNAVLKFIPYYAWDNREPGRMEVWVKYQEDN